MPVLRIRCVLYFLGFMAASLCMNDIEYERNYEDYDNEISQDQQEGGSPTPCQADFSRWDKLFIALEDSHMRQNMLMESLEQCCGGMVHIRTQLDKLAKATCQQCVPSMESACRAQAQQVNLWLQKELGENREVETRLNATLQMILRSNSEVKAQLKLMEKDRVVPSGAAGSKMGHQPTLQPGGSWAAFGSGMKPFPPDLKEQEVTAPLDMNTMERALVAIATELEKVHLQLSRVIEQAGTLGKHRGDT